MSKPTQKKKGPGPKRNTGSGAPSRQKSEKKGQKPQYTTKQKVLRGIYIALTVISAIIVGLYIAFNLFASAPDPDKRNEQDPDRTTITRPPMVTTTVDPDTGEEIEIEVPGLAADRKKEFYTFLLVGQSQDEGGRLCDTMMLAAYDVPNQTLKVMNLPRDTYVNYGGRRRLLNAVYNAAGGDKDGKGIAGLKNEVQALTGIYPDYHVIIQWEALGELVDAIGGVYFDVPFNMYYNDLSQHFKIDVKKGYQLLDGKKAMGVARWRQNSDDSGHISSSYGYAEGDLGRIKTQQALMKAIIAQCLQMDKLLTNLTDYISIFQRNVETDLTASNLAYFGRAALTGLSMDNVEFVTMPNKSAGDGHLLPIGDQIVSTINAGFNPYKESIQRWELDILTSVPLPSSSASQTTDPEESEDPKETEDPDETGEPGETEDPDASPRPTESGDDPVLPPGTITLPGSSTSPRPNNSESPAPSGSASPRPSGSASPAPSGSVSPAPSESASPPPTNSNTEPPSATPAAEPSTIPIPSGEPVPATPAPAPTEEPVLPPGV